MTTIDYKDWYINQHRLPDEESEEYMSFYEYHKDLCLNGFMMGDTYFNGFLYWHLNFWHTEVDIEEIGKNGEKYINQKYINPYLRDNEWDITNEIYRAERERKGLVILGIRRLAKSVLEASYIAMGATFDENSQNVIAGLNAADIKLVTDKIDKGLGRLPEVWKWQRIEDNWKNQVTLGVMTKKREKIPFSQILIRNLDDGNNEEVIAGTKPRKLIIDEIGKGNFLRGLKAAEPGFTTPYGWGCSPILTGTGGDMKKFFDAKKLMFDVEKYNFLSYKNDKDDRRVHGLFIGAKYRMEAKVESNLGTFLNKPEDSVLNQITMLISNEDKALQITKDAIEQNKKANDRVVYLKEKMYYPIEVDDIFLNEDTNIFNVEAAKNHQTRLRALGNGGTPVELYHTGEKITHKFSDKLPIMDFPVKNGESKDAPIMIYEFPIHSAPHGLYVCGVDSYKTGQAKYSDSLGCLYIFKRMHEISGEKFQHMFVASYTARPEDKMVWNEQARMLIKYYNALALVENDEMSFIDYMVSKGDSHHLVHKPEWLKEVVPNTTVNREFGVHRSSETMRNFLHGQFKQYMEEVIDELRDENGSVIKETLGVSRIPDPMLLEEVIQFNEDGNYDRIIAAELAIAQANKMNSIVIVKSADSDPRVRAARSRAMKKRAGATSPSPSLLKRQVKKIF